MLQDDEELVQGIKDLITLRKNAGIRVSSHIRILKAEKDLYVADISGDHCVIRCRIGPSKEMGIWEPHEDGWEKVMKEKNICIWFFPMA